MGGKEKMILNIASYGSDRKLGVCKGVPEGLGQGKSSLCAADVDTSGRLMFFRHLERVETMRCYWEQREQQFKAKKDDETFQLKNLKSQKKKKTPDEADTSQALRSEEVLKLNQENLQHSYDNQSDAEASLSDNQLQESKESLAPVSEEKGKEKEKEVTETDLQLEKQIEKDKQEPERLEHEGELGEVAMQKDEAAKDEEVKKEEDKDMDQPLPQSAVPDSTPSCEAMLSPKRHLSEENLQREEQKKSRVEERGEEEKKEEVKEKTDEEQQAAEVVREAKRDEDRTEAATGPLDVDAGVEKPAQEAEASTQEYIIEIIEEKHTARMEITVSDNDHALTPPTPSPVSLPPSGSSSHPLTPRLLPPPAPFEHRIVTTKTQQINAFYTINTDEILGGGRFGQVHKCVERASGLTLAAKIIKARSQKEKDIVRNEIHVMNQLNHANLIQLYAAFESRYGITLVLEYVEGGELFDRIIDDSCNLTELDTVLFIRQISEGLQYMHRMYILHLDLKPENILCVSRETNKIKIIDFGLARRYKPREKLRVNFGTPEFLAPEVINYDFVSFPTDMWSLGVITYMLLSGLSPFLGEDDNETLNNILACQWSFEEAEFTQTSDEAKDFITRLLVKSKCWRMSASQSLKHPWLSDRELHYRLYEKQKQLDPSKNTPPPPPLKSELNETDLQGHGTNQDQSL